MFHLSRFLHYFNSECDPNPLCPTAQRFHRQKQQPPPMAIHSKAFIQVPACLQMCGRRAGYAYGTERTAPALVIHGFRMTTMWNKFCNYWHFFSLFYILPTPSFFHSGSCMILCLLLLGKEVWWGKEINKVSYHCILKASALHTNKSIWHTPETLQMVHNIIQVFLPQ